MPGAPGAVMYTREREYQKMGLGKITALSVSQKVDPSEGFLPWRSALPCHVRHKVIWSAP